MFGLLQESDYFTPQGEFRVDKAGSPTLLNCLMYKMSYYRFGEMQVSVSSHLVIFSVVNANAKRCECLMLNAFSAAGLPHTSRVRPDTERGDRQQGYPSEALGGGVHFRTLAGAHLQGEEAGEQTSSGSQAS